MDNTIRNHYSLTMDNNENQEQNNNVNNDILDNDDDNETRYVPWICKSKWTKPISCYFNAYGSKHSIPALTHETWMVFWACSLVSFLGMWDWELLPACLSMIQKDLNITEENVGYVGSAIRMGNMLSFPIAGVADWTGRKNTMFFATLSFLSLCIGTAFVHDMMGFTILQTIARGFMAAQTTLSTTMIVETFDATNRGWGIGSMSAISVLGGAVALILYGFLGSSLDGWRWMYGLSAVLLIPLALLYRYVPESTKFIQQQQNQQQNKMVIPITENTIPIDRMIEQDEQQEQIVQINQITTKQLKWLYLKRLIVCGFVSFCNGVAFAPSETFKVKKLVEFHSISPPLLSFIQISTGYFAFASFTISGSLSDRYGRKKFLVIFNTLCAAGVFVFFVAPAQGPLVYLANFIQMLSGFVLMAVKSAYFAELFATKQRASLQSVTVVIEYLAGGLSLAMESVLYTALGNNHWSACAILALPGLLSGPLIWIFLPDTSGRDLDEVSPEIPTALFTITENITKQRSSGGNNKKEIKTSNNSEEVEEGMELSSSSVVVVVDDGV
jgi:MFS family permease